MLDRRNLLLVGAGALAAAGGAGLAWYQNHRVTRTVAGALPSDAALQTLWGAHFETLLGQRVAMQTLRGRPLLMNFWATWCPPCVEEFPLLDGFYQKNMAKGWQVFGLAIDKPDAVRAFLQKTPVRFPVALADAQGTELMRPLGNPTGGLPFSLLVSASGDLLQRKAGKLSAEELDHWATLA